MKKLTQPAAGSKPLLLLKTPPASARPEIIFTDKLFGERVLSLRDKDANQYARFVAYLDLFAPQVSALFRNRTLTYTPPELGVECDLDSIISPADLAPFFSNYNLEFCFYELQTLMTNMYFTLHPHLLENEL